MTTVPFALTGLPEWWIILLVVLVLFGGRKLPELARSMGSSITQFKTGLTEEREDPKASIDSGKTTDGE